MYAHCDRRAAARRARRGLLLPSLLLAPGLLALGACTTRTVERPSQEMAAVAPVLSVERFLRAANAGDFDAMARLFGTHEGSIEGRSEEIELRMSAIAEILRHRDYRIVSERREPGREHPTNRIGVDLVKGGSTVRDIAFLVVRSEEGRWLVQEIDLERITGA